MSLLISHETLQATHLTARGLERELEALLSEQNRLPFVQSASLAGIRLLHFQQLLAGRGIGSHYDVPEFEQHLKTLSSQGVA